MSDIGDEIGSSQAKLPVENLRETLESVTRQLADKEKTLEALNRELVYLNSLEDGTYFALIDDTFQGSYRDIHKDPIQHGKMAYRSVCRPIGSTEQQFRSETKSGEFVKEYEITAKFGESSLKGADGSDDQSETSSESSTKKDIWRATVFGDRIRTPTDPTHLVPAKVRQANTFWFVTDFLFGWDPNRKWDTRLRLLHGVNKADTTERKDHTGIKHSIANKIVLDCSKYYFDEAPNVILIPICNSEEVKAWDGKGYDAIVLIDVAPLDDDGIESDASHFEDSDDNVHVDSPLAKRRAAELPNVSCTTRFARGQIELATPEEVRKAHQLVKVFTNAIVYAQTNAAPKEIAGNETLQRFAEAGNIFETALAELEGKKFRKIRFADHQTGKGHPAPDPILLATRAAVQLQRRHGIALVEAGGTVNDEMDELSVLAMEEFLRQRDLHQEQKMIGSDIAF